MTPISHTTLADGQRMQRGGEASIEVSAPVRTQAFYVDDSRFIAQCLILNKFLYSLVIKQHIT